MARTTPTPTTKDSPKTVHAPLAFLLSQVGAHVAACFADRIAPLGLKPPHAGILSIVGTRPGITQQALADLLGIFPSRLVALLDELGDAKLIERRSGLEDRRTYALHLTKAGRESWMKMGKLAAGMENDLCAALNEKERGLLGELLSRIAAQQKIAPGVHPGYRRMDGTCG